MIKNVAELNTPQGGTSQSHVGTYSTMLWYYVVILIMLYRQDQLQFKIQK